MAITYAAGTGTVITSPIVYETLGSQAGAGSDEVILATAALTPSTHANYGGNVGDNTTGTGPGDVYVGRLIVVRVGAADEEVKMCIGATDLGATISLQVHEDWDAPPVSSDVLNVSYTCDDIETGGASGGVSYSSKTKQYIFSNMLDIGNATDFAMLQLGPAESMEINDSGGAAIPDFIVENNGMLCSGYLFGGVPVAGGYITSDQNADGEETWDALSGSMMRLYDTDLKLSLNDLKVDWQSGADIDIRSMKNYQFTYGCNLLDGSYEGIKWIGGSGGASDYVFLAEETTVLDWILMFTGGLATETGDTSAETVTVRDIVFIDNSALITVNSNKTWYVVNPIWTATTYTDFTWLTSTANYVYDQRSVDVVVQTAAGTKLENANVLIYEGTTDNLVLETFSDAAGIASGVFTYKLHSTNSSTVTYGTHAFRVDLWDYFPFAAAQTSNEERSGSIVLSPDSNIVAASQAAALTDGTGITWNDETNPSSIISYTGGLGTLSVGNTVTGGSSGADGLVTKIVDGDSTAGTVHLKTRDANDFTGTEGLSNGAGWTATLTTASQQDFSIWIDGISTSMQITHDYLAALTSQTTLSATGELIHEWGNRNQVRALYKGASGYYTNRSGTNGVFITNFGAGTIEKFTDDDGGTWTPPSSVTLTITCKNTSGLPISGVKIRIETDPGGTLISEGTTNSSGIFEDSYTYVGDVDVKVVARLKGYIFSSALSIIETGGLNVPFTMIADRAVDLP